MGKTSRYTLLDIPDVLLVASLVLATKYMYPMDGVKRYPRDANDPLTLKMDWDAWEAEFADPPDKPLRRLDFAVMDAEKIWTLSKEHMVEYLDWYQETQLKAWSAAGMFTTSAYSQTVDSLLTVKQTKPKSTASSLSKTSCDFQSQAAKICQTRS